MSLQLKYERVQLLAEGDSSRIYRGQHKEFNRAVAIKELRDEVQRSPKRKERYFREAETWAGFSNERLTTIYEIDRAVAWTVMELLPGSAAHDLRQGAVSPQRAEEILRQGLLGLEYLHRQNYLHGNVKPGNILYDASGGVKLSDGRCLPLSGGGELPAPRGKNKYLAPEMLDESFGAVGPGADLYCLGFVVAELVLGPQFDSLFTGTDAGSADPNLAWLRWHSSAAESLPPLRDLAPGLPSHLSRVLDGLLQKSLQTRYRQAADALEDLSKFAADAPRKFPEASAKGGNGLAGNLPAHAGMTSPGMMSPRSPSPAPAASAAPSPTAVAGQRTVPSIPSGETRPGAVAPTDADIDLGPMPGTIITRLNTPIVLRIASGVRAGEMLCLEGDEFRVGDSDDCQLRFLPREYPYVAGRQLNFRRGADGWKVRCIGLGGSLLDGAPFTEAPLRSGSIVRMSWMGPDLQVVFQSPNAPTLASIAARFSEAAAKTLEQVARSGPSAVPSSGPSETDAASGWGAPPAPPQGAPLQFEPPHPGASQPTAGSAASAPYPAVAPAAPRSAPPVAPAPPTAPSPATTASPRRLAPPTPAAASAGQGSGQGSGQGPGQGSGQGPGQGREFAPAPPTRSPAGPAAGGEASAAASSHEAPRKRFSLDYRQWSKSKQNWVAGGIATAVALVVVVLWPVNHPPEDEPAGGNSNRPAATSPPPETAPENQSPDSGPPQ